MCCKKDGKIQVEIIKKIDPLLDEIAKVDITEITGFDDLHHPEEMIRDLMDNLKQIYGSVRKREAFSRH